MSDVISKALICGISEYQSWPALPGAAKDAALGLEVLSDDLGAASVTTALVGEVTSDALHREFEQAVDDLERSEDLPEFPILLALISCHAVQKGHQMFPHLIPSDAPRGEGAWSFAFDVEECFLKRLQQAKFRCRKVKKLRAILVFDCCRSILLDSQHASRGLPNYRNWVTSLKHDFYVIFSCDPGSRALEEANGGALMSVLLPALKYAKKIPLLFLHVSSRVGCQRPHDCNRPGEPFPILGSVRGQPDGWSLDDRDEPGNDLRQVAVLVLSGITGHGKSTLGNILSSQQKFKVNGGLSSETRSVEHVNVRVRECNYRIIDTPGFSDTSLSVEENWAKFSEFADRAPAGIDVFLHVVEWRKFKDEELRGLTCLQEVAGKGCDSYVLLVFSKAPPNFYHHVVEERRKNHYLNAALEKVADFTAVHDGEDKEAQERVLLKVQSLMKKHNGQKHSNQSINMANANRRELVEIGKQLHGSEAREVCDLIQKVYHGSRGSAEALARARDMLMHQAMRRQLEPSQSNPLSMSDSETLQIERSAPGVPQAFGQVFDGMKAIGASAQAQADKQDGLMPQLFTRMWSGGVNFMAEQHEKAYKISRVAEDAVLKLQEMGFAEEPARSALSKADGNIEQARERLLNESAS